MSKKEFVVEQILAKQVVENEVQYLLKWKGYPEEESTWEPEKNIQCPKLLKEFNEKCSREENNENTWEPEDNSSDSDELKESEDEYIAKERHKVERIISKKYEDEKVWFLLKWEGFPEEEATWEPEENLFCKDLIEVFETERFEAVISGQTLDDASVTGFDQGLEPEKIIEAALINGEIHYLIGWSGSPETDVVPAKLANLKCPQLVIKFHEERVTWEEN
ncbi:chromobox protein homolog 3-like [Nilaparvata lugens]|uniref:chromobox protein homolog 3-like n=1 Tax=Nilaparvata lugens TaxID=108931 RepID=UPI00193E940A|nr:chromobox protein homolog 3-like [Nilaparvata lugens]